MKATIGHESTVYDTTWHRDSHLHLELAGSLTAQPFPMSER
jgi:hypothetical protein